MPARVDVSALREAAESEVANGLAACQLAVGRQGEIVWTESFGSARPVVTPQPM